MKTNIATINNTFKPLASIVLGGILLATLSACSGGGGGGGPTTPGVSSVNPASGATNVSKSTVVTATFRDGMDEVDLAANIQSEFTLVDNSLTSISGVAAYDDVLNVASFNPGVNLGVLKGYTANIGAGGTITHSGGTVMPEYTWSFTTAEGAWGTAENIEIDPSSDFSNPKVAVAGNGDAMAIWMSISGSTWIVHYNKYTSSTDTWGNMQTLTSSTNNEISSLRIAMDNSGNAMAVWRVDPPGGNLDLVASYYNGTSWDVSPTTIDAGGGVASEPQVAFDASGNAMVVFIHAGSVYANRYSSGVWEGAQAIDAGPDTVYAPQIAVFDNGDAIAVWAQYNVAATYDIVYANHYDVGTGMWGGATSLQNSATGSIPQVAVGDGGDAIAVWIQGTASPYNAVASVYDGATWGSPDTLDNDAHINTVPQVGIGAAGNGIAMWRADPLSAGIHRLRYKVYTSGSGWSANVATNIDNGVTDSSQPKLIMDDEGHAIAIWKQDTDSMTAVASTWANRYRSDTGTWGTPTLLETDDTDPAGITSPSLGMNKYNGNAFAIWLQNHDVTFNSVWVNHFD